MNVKELKDALATLPDEMEVILQKDSEGNGYSPLSGADAGGIYIPRNTYSGTTYSEKWSANEADMTEDEWAEVKAKSRSLILWPIN